MQVHNAHIVLELLKRSGPISRADIARSLGSSKSAISNITTLLGEFGLIRSSGVGHPHTGRTSELIEFDPSGRLFIGIDLSWEKKVFAAVDLSGRIVASSQASFGTSAPSGLVKRIADCVENLVSKGGLRREVIEGIGVMIPGLVDPDSGTILHSRSVVWNEGESLSALLTSRLGIPVTLENDANALALGEDWVGKGRDFTTLAYVYLGEGLGGAFVSGGSILQGADHAASELGKMLVGGGREPVRAEKALLGLFAEISRALSLGGRTENEVQHAVAEAYRSKDTRLKRLEGRIIQVLAQLLVNIVAVLNPEVIIINSPYLPLQDSFLDELGSRVYELLPERPRRTLRLIAAALDRQSGVIGGAAVAVLRSQFQFIISGAPPPQRTREGMPR